MGSEQASAAGPPDHDHHEHDCHGGRYLPAVQESEQAGADKGEIDDEESGDDERGLARAPQGCAAKGAIRYRGSRGESDSVSEMRWIPIALMGVHGLIHLMESALVRVGVRY